MKAEELRIGNLLQDKVSNTLLKVIELTEKDVITYVIDRSKFPLQKGWGLQPIPLTEEWLLMFGAEKIYASLYDFEGYEFGYFSFTEDGLIIVFQSQQLCEPIKYVHQLQNLYFALTGEELTIKTK